MEFFGWSNDIVMDMQAMFRDGKSASDAAAKYEGCTRNAVIGKMHRLGLPAGGGVFGLPKPRPARHLSSLPTTNAVRPMSNLSRAPTLFAGAPTEAERVQIGRERIAEMRKTAFVCEPGQGVTLEGLTRHGCRWPLGEVGDAAFRYCGTERGADRAYCPTHHVLAHIVRVAS